MGVGDSIEKKKFLTDERRAFLLIVVFIAFFLAIIIGIPAAVHFSENPKMTDSAYNKAVEYMEQGDFDSAYRLLSRYKYDERESYRDAQAFYWLCSAHRSYDGGYYKIAADEYDNYVKSRKYIHPETDESAQEFGKTVKEKYDSIEKEKEEKILNKIKDGVPYEGMPEEYIDRSSLGRHSDYKWSYVSGQRYVDRDSYSTKTYYGKADYYYFKSGGKVIFVAQCFEGAVRNTWDERNGESNKSYPSLTQPAKKPSNSSSKTTKKYDPDVDEFGDAEDYYDWYYDDYYDFEDAEEYFDEYY